MAYTKRILDSPALVRPAEAAKQLGISQGVLYYKIHAGLVRYERIGKHYYILQAVIDRILAADRALESLLTAQQYYDGVAATARENTQLITLARRAAALAALAPE